jgi:hypothetical protein
MVGLYRIHDNCEFSPVSLQLKGEIEKLSDGEFQGRSLYKDSYPVHKIDQIKMAPPTTSFKPTESRTFHTETEYHRNFPKKEKIEQEKFEEKPALSYNLIYPENMPGIPQKSYKNTVHDGQRGEKVEKCLPYKDSVQLGTDYQQQVTTTSKTFFRPYKLSPVQSLKPKNTITKRGRFSATTQNKLDYKYNENEARAAKQQICPEYPSLINLSMDAPVDFQTVKMMSYNGVPNKQHKHVIAKKLDTYTPPKEKFDAKTTSQVDFQSFGVQNRQESIRPVLNRKSSAKIQKDSSYSSQYKNPGKTNRILYDAQYEDNLRLPPKSEKFSDKSVMQSDFRNRPNTEKVKPFKPDYTLHSDSTKQFDGTTHYQDFYKMAEHDPCTFTKYLAQQEARRFATIKSWFNGIELHMF